ncbi:coat protein [Melinis repens associated virus]|uniref:Capsid protein n=1 Tax=Melinis repens associated virus TaxID=2596882 RepID=A0A516F3K0_9GEMI|nr:coat protein [Melinis repens associated virus]QDO73337.1 coat protein [Melinis repens associated virus]
MPAARGSTSRKRTRDDWAWDSRKRRRVRPTTSAIPRGPRGRRPSLQVDQDVYAGPTLVEVPAVGGIVGIMTNFMRGSDESARHTAETILYKIGIDVYVTVSEALTVYSGKGVNVAWLVYDAQPTGTRPTCADIFPLASPNFNTQPCVWKVGREVCHRFVVKRRWLFTLETNGVRPGTSFSGANGVPPCNRSLYFHKFCKRLGVRTEWKNTPGGTDGDIKTGALYLVFAAGNKMSFSVSGVCRKYFKSVGNQ